MTIGDRHAQTAPPRSPANRCREAGATSCQAAPAERPSAHGAGAAGPPRPERWAAAVATLIALQDEYRGWLDNLPENLERSRLADKLHAITELDLEELQAVDPPRGYGRD
jgi:hypothetical protein